MLALLGCSDGKTAAAPISSGAPLDSDAIDDPSGPAEPARVVAAPIIFTGSDGYYSGVYSIKSDGSDLRLIVPDAYQPSLSPDGQELLVTTRDGILRVGIDGSGGQLVAQGNLHNPGWSRSGKHIFFMHGGDINVADPDGGVARRVAGGWSNPRWLASDENQFIVTKTNPRSADLAEVWLTDAETEESMLILSNAYIPDVTYPSSPDGRDIIIGGFVGGLSIRVLNLETHRQSQIGRPGPEGPWSAAWSPDGSLIAHDQYRGRDGLWLSTPDGAVDALIVPGWFKEAPVAPAWSPDGTMIAFHMMNFNGGPSRIHVVNADGTGLKKLVDGQYAQWCPMPVGPTAP